MASSSAFLAAHALGKGVDTKEVAVGCDIGLLPSGCVEVDYIANTNVSYSYIDTGLSYESIDDDLEVTITASALPDFSSSNYKNIIGSFNELGTESTYTWVSLREVSSSDDCIVTVGNKSNWTRAKFPMSPTFGEMSLSLSGSKVNGVKYAVSSPTVNFPSPIPVYLLGQAAKATGQSIWSIPFHAKLKRCYATRGGKTIFYATAISDNGVAAMFDYVGRTIIRPTKPFVLPTS